MIENQDTTSILLVSYFPRADLAIELDLNQPENSYYNSFCQATSLLDREIKQWSNNSGINMRLEIRKVEEYITLYGVFETPLDLAFYKLSMGNEKIEPCTYMEFNSKTDQWNFIW